LNEAAQRSGVGLEELLDATDRGPERYFRRSCEESPGDLHERLDMWLLHVWAEEDLLARPPLNEADSGQVVYILKHSDATTIWLKRLDFGYERTNLANGSVDLCGKNAIANDDSCFAHEHTP